MKQYWKDRVVAEWEANGGKEKAKREKERKERVQRRADHAQQNRDETEGFLIPGSTKIQESNKQNQDVDGRITSEKNMTNKKPIAKLRLKKDGSVDMQANQISLEAADGEGFSAMEQRIHHLSQTLSRVGRVLDRHREKSFETSCMTRSSASAEFLRGQIHSPLAVMTDDAVIGWIFNHPKGVTQTLLRVFEEKPWVNSPLPERMAEVTKKYVALKSFSYNIGEDRTDPVQDVSHTVGPAEGRRQLTAALLELRGTLLVIVNKFEQEAVEFTKEQSRLKARKKREYRKREKEEKKAIAKAEAAMSVVLSSDQEITFMESPGSVQYKPIDGKISNTSSLNKPGIFDSSQGNGLTKRVMLASVQTISESASMEHDDTALVASDVVTKEENEEIQMCDDTLPSPWVEHLAQKDSLEAAADLLLMYAHTSTFFFLDPYFSFKSSPVEVYARELGNAVPLSIIGNVNAARKDTSSDCSGRTVDTIHAAGGQVSTKQHHGQDLPRKPAKPSSFARRGKGCGFCEGCKTIDDCGKCICCLDEAAADLLLMYAHTSTFFFLDPYFSFKSSPVEVYARELGNAVPLSIIGNVNAARKDTSSDCSGRTVDTIHAAGGQVSTKQHHGQDLPRKPAKPSSFARRGKGCGFCEGCKTIDDCGKCICCLDKPKFGGKNIRKQKCKVRRCTRNGVPEKKMKDAASDAGDEEKKKSYLYDSVSSFDHGQDCNDTELCAPDDVITSVTVQYSGDYVLSSLLQWYTGGIGLKPGLPDMAGCIVIPSMTACFQRERRRTKIHLQEKSYDAGTSRYRAEIQPKLVQWFEDRFQRGGPWPKEVSEFFITPGEAEIEAGACPLFGSPILDLLLSGDETNIYKVLQDLRSQGKDNGVIEDTTSDLPRRKKSKKSATERLQSTMDDSMPQNVAVANWVQCEDPSCMKWRKLPWHVDVDLLPEKFFCKDNIWNPNSNSCLAPEEEWDMNDAPVRFSDGINEIPEEKFVCAARFDILRTGKKQYCEGIVVDVDFASSVKKVLFHFPRMATKWDEWIEINSPRIAPHHSYTRLKDAVKKMNEEKAARSETQNSPLQKDTLVLSQPSDNTGAVNTLKASKVSTENKSQQLTTKCKKSLSKQMARLKQSKKASQNSSTQTNISMPASDKKRGERKKNPGHTKETSKRSPTISSKNPELLGKEKINEVKIPHPIKNDVWKIENKEQASSLLLNFAAAAKKDSSVNNKVQNINLPSLGYSDSHYTAGTFRQAKTPEHHDQSISKQCGQLTLHDGGFRHTKEGHFKEVETFLPPGNSLTLHQTGKYAKDSFVNEHSPSTRCHFTDPLKDKHGHPGLVVQNEEKKKLNVDLETFSKKAKFLGSGSRDTKNSIGHQAAVFLPQGKSQSPLPLQMGLNGEKKHTDFPTFNEGNTPKHCSSASLDLQCGSEQVQPDTPSKQQSVAAFIPSLQ